MAERLSNGTRNAALAALRTTYANGVLEIYSGTQPTSAEAIETGDMLCRITLASGAFTPGVATNGINFDAPVAGVLSKAAAETWSGVAALTGTAGWFRFYTNAYHTGADTDDSKIRFDGLIGSSGCEINSVNRSITAGGTVTVATFTFTLPAA